jgi:predicted KAP-like P-loop ATPase
MFISDNPILKKDEDTLRRKSFSIQLAKTIAEWDMEESMVIGINGPWGSGKTSIINMTIDELLEITKAKPKEAQPIIVWFNPWNYSDKDLLLRAFFQQLFSEIYKIEPNQGKNIKETLENLGNTLVELGDIPHVGDYLKAGGGILKLFTKEKSLVEQKNAVNELFKKLQRRIVIIIDDIDRLTIDEIQLLFQIIKMNADFSNTIYITSFDRKIVETSLSTASGINGHEFLKKIVQISFDIPKVEQSLVHKYLFSELDKILNGLNVKNFDKDQWSELCIYGYLDLFLSLRDVKQYINSLKITLPIVYKEVNIVDFLGLEAIRVFLPGIFQQIGKNPSLFLYEDTIWKKDTQHLNKYIEKLDEIYSIDGREFSEVAKKILLFLFPKLRTVSDGFPTLKQNPKDDSKRICLREYFQNYYLLGIPYDEISQDEFENFIQSLSNFQDLENDLAYFIKINKHRKLIHKLRVYKDTLNSVQLQNGIKVFMELLSTIPDEYTDVFDIGSDTEQEFLIYFMLEKLNSEERYLLFQSIIQSSKYLSAIVSMLAFLSPRNANAQQTPIFNDDQIGILSELTLEKIILYSDHDSIFEEKNFPSILYYWRKWEKTQEHLKIFLIRVEKEEKILLKFVNCFIKEINTQNSEYVDGGSNKILDMDSLTKYISLERLQELLSNIINTDPSEFDENMVQLHQLIKKYIYPEEKTINGG